MSNKMPAGVSNHKCQNRMRRTNRRKYLEKWLAAGALLAAAAMLLAVNTRAGETNTAARAWAALTNFALPQPPLAWATNPPAQADLEKFDDARAAKVAVLADEARAFYTQFPDDPNAPRARSTELQALQAAVHYGATNRLADLLAREQEMIADTNAPEEMRYELRLDQLGRELKAQSAAGADMPAEMEKAGRGLVKEFPRGPAGYELLQEIAENADMLKMQELARFMANSGGPAELTGIGKGLLRRVDAVGKPLPIAFTAMDGRQVNLTTLSNKVVLVDFWGTWCPVCVQETPELKKLYDQYHARGFEIVGVDFDEDTNTVQRFLKEHDVPWPQYFGGKEDNKYGKQYSLNFFPNVWLADRKGIVRDIHGREDLEAKVAKLMAE
jgi:thiol-disulfide isomerase/thioredoxin